MRQQTLRCFPLLAVVLAGIAFSVPCDADDDFRTTTAVAPQTLDIEVVAYYFHGWDPNQFPEHKSYKWLIPGLMKPLHNVGGQGHLRFGINHLEPGAFVQDTRVGLRPWTEAPRDGAQA